MSKSPNSESSAQAKKPGGFREWLRKRLVGLKRRPSIIVLLALVIAFVYFSFNLTLVSDTTAVVSGANMGLSAFVMMLFGILSMVCMLNAFPVRRKTNWPMLILAVLMVGVILYANRFYSGSVAQAILSEPGTYGPDGRNAFVANTIRMMNIHAILLCGTLGLLVTLPIYGHLIRKINTNIEVAGNSGMGQLDLSGEDA